MSEIKDMYEKHPELNEPINQNTFDNMVACGEITERNPKASVDEPEQVKSLLCDGHDLEIKFSHHYLKLCSEHVFNEAQLIEAIKVDLKNLSKVFLDYDTDEGAFVLPKQGKFYMLLFKTEQGHVFTTLRRFNKKTTEKYKNNIGEWFKITILYGGQAI